MSSLEKDQIEHQFNLFSLVDKETVFQILSAIVTNLNQSISDKVLFEIKDPEVTEVNGNMLSLACSLTLCMLVDGYIFQTDDSLITIIPHQEKEILSTEEKKKLLNSKQILRFISMLSILFMQPSKWLKESINPDTLEVDNQTISAVISNNTSKIQ